MSTCIEYCVQRVIEQICVLWELRWMHNSSSVAFSQPSAVRPASPRAVRDSVASLQQK